MKIKGKEYFSVSQLELWASCKRAWYLVKRLGYTEKGKKDNKYLIRGSLVHEMFEKYYDKDILPKLIKHKDFKRLDKQFQEETINIFKLFEHSNQMPSPPIKKEMEIINHELEMVAYIDVVGKDYIVDYKTSRFWKSVPQNYWWQLKIYAMLYFLETGKLIKNLGVYYVKYGKIYWITISESDIVKIKAVVVETIKAIKKSEQIGDFDKCSYNGRWECACKKVTEPSI